MKKRFELKKIQIFFGNLHTYIALQNKLIYNTLENKIKGDMNEKRN